MCVRGERFVRGFGLENWEGEDPGVDWSIILKLVLKKLDKAH
jgi:hypothetical protein